MVVLKLKWPHSPRGEKGSMMMMMMMLKLEVHLWRETDRKWHGNFNRDAQCRVANGEFDYKAITHAVLILPLHLDCFLSLQIQR